jgi:6-pyruvoyl-tetrahydropterin synthase
MKPMDHKNLDVDVAYFHTRPSTAENVAVFIWEQMAARLPDPSLLYEVHRATCGRGWRCTLLAEGGWLFR